MKLIKPSFEILDQEPGLAGVYKAIEKAGRTCYKSEDKITANSAEDFVKKMIKSGHGAMLEHGTIYLKDTYSIHVVSSWEGSLAKKYSNNKYSIVNYDRDLATRGIYITTNFRVLIENNWLDDLQFICEPTQYHEKRYTVRFICDRGVSHEFVRHRVMSFAQESSRYCNYSKDKFGKEITYIIPVWMDKYDIFKQEYCDLNTLELIAEPDANDKELTAYYRYIKSLFEAEKSYFELLNLGWSPQQARNILPTSLKTELVMTGFGFDWYDFFKLRCAENAHPQAVELAQALKTKFL